MTKFKIARIVTVSLGILVVVAGVLGELRYGALCTLDLWIFSVTDPVVGPLLRSLGVWRVELDAACPLGFLERSLAARELLPQWPSVLLVVLSIILLGRVFCAWICPTVLLRRLFGDKVGSRCKQDAAPKAASGAGEASGAGKANGAKWASYSPHAVLAGVLISSYLFRFPVFCLFCPIGLFFGFFYAAARALTPDSFGLELVLFPALLGLELWGLKSWCRSICPVGAVLSIIGSFNRFLLPTFRKDKCLTSKGVNCGVCERVCPEGIELSKIGSGLVPNSCTKCLACYEKCPKGAIEIALVR